MHPGSPPRPSALAAARTSRDAAATAALCNEMAGLQQDELHEAEIERATLRLRLVGIALASTILILAPRSDQPAAAAALLSYAFVATLLRYAAPRVRGRLLPVAGVAADIAFATSLAILLPLSQPTWAVYAIPIAVAAMRYGSLGAASATAGAIVAYDVALGLRQGDATAADLWPVQVLLALGILAAELVWTIARGEADRRLLRAHALAQRDLALCRTADELLDRLIEHAVHTFGASAAWIEAHERGGGVVAHSRGIEPAAGDGAGRTTRTASFALSSVPRTTLVAALEPNGFERSRAALRDVATDAMPLLAAARQREQHRVEREQLTSRAEDLERHVDELGRELKERDDSVASAVHELRNPLTSVQAYGQLMSKNLQAVQRQVAQLDRLIDDLLRIQHGSLTVGTLETVDLLREAREAANRLRLVTAAEVRVVGDGSERFVVHGDAGRLAQVLDNLLRNAAKFSPPGKPITVELRREGGEALVAVSDRGSGIPADDLPHIFERYYRGAGHQREVAGAGIGLAVSREIVTAHGGRIWATSRGEGHGSTFWIALPLEAGAGESTRAAEVSAG